MKLMFASDLHGSLPATKKRWKFLTAVGRNGWCYWGIYSTTGHAMRYRQVISRQRLQNVLIPIKTRLLLCGVIAIAKSIRCYYSSLLWLAGSRLLCQKHVYFDAWSPLSPGCASPIAQGRCLSLWSYSSTTSRVAR